MQRVDNHGLERSPYFGIGKIIASYGDRKTPRYTEETCRVVYEATLEHIFGTMGGIPSEPKGLEMFIKMTNFPAGYNKSGMVGNVKGRQGSRTDRQSRVLGKP